MHPLVCQTKALYYIILKRHLPFLLGRISHAILFIAKRSLEILMDILCKRCWRHIVLTHWDVCVMVLLMTCAFISACPWFPYHNTIWFIYSLFIFSYLIFYFVYSHVQAKLSDLTKNDLIQLISHLEHEVGYRDSVINDMMVCLMSSHRHSIV